MTWRITALFSYLHPCHPCNSWLKLGPSLHVIPVDWCAFVVIIGFLTMSDERIEKAKSAVDASDHIPADKKAALSATLSKLKPALAEISQTHQEHAETITRLVEASAHETTRQEKRPEHLKKLSQELRQSVENFEASHPDLAAFVNQYSTLLSALGI
jgi:prefoldin subunit 5